MVFSTIEANKIARSALALLKISVGYRMSKSILNVLIKILDKNGVKVEGGAKKYKMKGGVKSAEVKAIEVAAVKLLKVALAYDLSKTVLEEIAKVLKKNGYDKKEGKK